MNVSLSAGKSRRRFVIASVIGLVAVWVATSSLAFAATPKVGEKAPDFELKALDDSKVKLSELLKKGPVVLVLLRGYPGYQCPVCNMQVGSLIGKSDKFEEAKAQVVLVYPGQSEGLKAHADEFVQGKKLAKVFRLVMDPDYEFTKKYDLRWSAPNETSYPSTFVLDQKGKILFAKVSHSHGDRARVDDILKALAQ